ncbi:MAG: hypothetical protein PHF61_07125, partial [Bacteroidales bacterium]|nr:hypothetical protein [Bacteroidales bacterium]
YRAEEETFEQAFFELYPQLAGSPVAACWKARLSYSGEKGILLTKGPQEISKTRSSGDAPEAARPISLKNILWLILICVCCGLLIKLPEILNFEERDFLFFERNAGLIVLFGLSGYAFSSRKVYKPEQVWLSLALFILSAIYVNVLPTNRDSAVINLIYIHLPLMLWCLYGLIFIDFNLRDKSLRMDYLRHNGDLVIFSTLLVISGGVLTAMTLGLFSVIDLNIEKFYLEYIVMIGAVSVPVVAAFVLRHYSVLTNKIAPIIASLFNPLVVISLLAYLLSILITGKDLYGDREFLLLFNLMLLGVMALVVFSVSELKTQKRQVFNLYSLLVLLILSLIIDALALSAIIYRLSEYGFTPNRTAVLGSNLLILIHLLLIVYEIFKILTKKKSLTDLESAIGSFLPVYLCWTLFVIIGFPFIFGLN